MPAGRRTLIASPTRIGLAASIAVAFCLFIIFQSLEAGNAEAVEANLALHRAETNLYAVSAAEWEAVARGQVEPEATERAEERLRALSAWIDASGLATSSIGRRHRDYTDAVLLELAAIRSGDLEAAEALDETRVDPSFSALEHDLHAHIEARRLEMVRAARVESLLRFLTLAAGVATIGLVLRARELAQAGAHAAQLEQERLAAGERVLEAITRSTPDVLLVVGADRRILFAGGAARALLGVDPPALLGRNLDDLVIEADRPLVTGALLGVASTRSPNGRVAASLLRHDGSVLNAEIGIGNALADPELRALVLNVRDQSARIELEQMLEHKAFHDALTGLPNRAAFSSHIAAAIQRAPAQRAVGLLLLDVDDFKEVNDTLGHPAGDELLVKVAQRLTGSVRGADLVARLGGDEFAILLEGLSSESVLPSVANSIQRALAEPVAVQGRNLTVRVSIGGAVHAGRDDGTGGSADTLVSNADLAMYEAKRSGGGAFVPFIPAMVADTHRQIGLREDLRQAVREGGLHLNLQPIVDLSSGTVCGAEALVRWRHPQRGLVPPSEFIPIAERAGLIKDVGRFVLREACQAARSWPSIGGVPLHVAVNLSGVEFQREDFVGSVLEALAESGLPPSQLVLEITEQALIQDVRVASRHVEALREHGVRFALDDFGTGYSSLAYLRAFPIDWLKVDKSFVEGLPSDAQDAVLVAAIVAMAGALGIEVVAEGIETVGQRDHLQRLRCRFAQGYLFSRPLEVDAFVRFLDDAKDWPSVGAPLLHGPGHADDRRNVCTH